MLKSLKTHFKPGDGYRCVVLSVDEEKKLLDLSINGENFSVISRLRVRWNQNLGAQRGLVDEFGTFESHKTILQPRWSQFGCWSHQHQQRSTSKVTPSWDKRIKFISYLALRWSINTYSITILQQFAFANSDHVWPCLYYCQWKRFSPPNFSLAFFFPSLSIGTITQIYHRGEIQQFKLNHCTSSVKAGSKIEVTQVLTGQVAKIFPDQGLLVRLPMYKYGVVGLTDLSDNYEENPLESFTTMQLVR